jgi:hypothetical protein
MNRSMLTLCLVIIVVLFGISEGITANYFPVDEGLVREYKGSKINKFNLSQRFGYSITNLGKHKLEGQEVYILKYSGGLTVYAIQNKEGYGKYAQQGRSDFKPKILEQIHYYVKFPLKEETTWQNKEKSNDFQQFGEFNVTNTIETVDDFVAVHAGTFKKCIRIKRTATVKGRYGTLQFEGYYWYAPNVGYVKGLSKFTVGSSKVEIQCELSGIKK